MSVQQILKPVGNLDKNKTVVLCVGSRLKGDDAAGCIVCDLLKGRMNIEVIDAGIVPENFIGQIIKKTPQNVIIIDAVDFSAPAGSVKLFDPSQAESFSISTHSVSLKLLCDCIGSETICRFFLIGIQPAQTDFNSSLSAEAQAAAEAVADELIKIFG
ncbi:MAG: hydrogenase maturation protease [Planctomycetes bacterium]|nr:hydrogenase maturation protease [Planctomycetota bacterium]MBU1518883.1 hydrogenase maturation protease [Planctomycetota bacterium]MBU2457073.1 hydrogenase maturation protease [Planctomycetota bacterium]MBU2596323.1 hydrogenase maturation protease [Planctomycetota bacterium]